MHVIVLLARVISMWEKRERMRLAISTKICTQFKPKKGNRQMAYYAEPMT